MNKFGITITTIKSDINTTDYWLHLLHHRAATTSFEEHLIQALQAARNREARYRLAVAFPCLYQAWAIYQQENVYA